MASHQPNLQTFRLLLPLAHRRTAAKSSEPSELHNRRQPWWVEYLHRSRTPVIRRELTFLRFLVGNVSREFLMCQGLKSLYWEWSSHPWVGNYFIGYIDPYYIKWEFSSPAHIRGFWIFELSLSVKMMQERKCMQFLWWSRCWFQIFCIFTPNLGEDSQFD